LIGYISIDGLLVTTSSPSILILMSSNIN